MHQFLTAVFVSIVLFSSAKAQPGSLDATFGTGGLATFLPQPILNKGYGLAVQTDHKILLAGYVLSGAAHLFHLTRLMPDGTPDLAFGTNGTVETLVGTDALCFAVCLQTDGKILLAGSTKPTANASTDFAVLRYLPNGRPDSTFSADGTQTLSFATGDDAARAIAAQPDGKILVAGTSFNNNGSQMAIARLKTDGSPDPSFSGDGKAMLGIGNFFTEAYALALQPDGKTVVAGAAKFGMADDIAVARFLPNGNLDTAFGASGYVTTNLGSDADVANALALQPDGKILVAGTSGATRDFVLSRYSENGLLDLGFANQGTATTDFFGSDDIANAVLMQPDGKILLGGYAYNGLLPDFALARYLPNGTLDAGFGTNGLAAADFDNSYDYAFPMAAQPDGKIILGGYSFSNGHTALALTRFVSGLNVGIVDFDKPELVTIAPNPVGRSAVLKFETRSENNFSLSLSDPAGRVCQIFFTGKKLAAGLHSEDILFNDGLIAGWYFLNLSNGKTTFAVKILKS